jgi:hypothetical protein
MAEPARFSRGETTSREVTTLQLLLIGVDGHFKGYTLKEGQARVCSLNPTVYVEDGQGQRNIPHTVHSTYFLRILLKRIVGRKEKGKIHGGVLLSNEYPLLARTFALAVFPE